MPASPQDIILIGILLSDLALLAVSRLGRLIQLAGFQGALLAASPLVFAPPGAPLAHLLPLCLAVLAIKAVAFPWLLGRTMRRVGVTTMVEPYVSFSLSVVLGLGGLLFSLWLGSRLPLPDPAFRGLVIPAAMTTMLAGLVLLIARRKALTQVVGYLVMENGIFLFGAPMADRGSVWIELSVLLDVLVAVFVMGIAIHHISRTFESIDVDRFCSLRD